jgi:hypothetical protein
MYSAIHFGVQFQWSINIDQNIQLLRTESHFIKRNWNANVVTCLISAWRRCDNNTKIQYHLLMPHQTSVAYCSKT